MFYSINMYVNVWITVIQKECICRGETTNAYKILVRTHLNVKV